MIAFIVVATIAIARRSGVLEQSFELQFLGRIHHFDTPSAGRGHADIEPIGHRHSSMIATLRSNLEHTVGCFDAIKSTSGGIFEHFDAADVLRIEIIKRLGRDDLPVEHVQRLVSLVATAQRRVAADAYFGRRTQFAGVDNVQSCHHAL